MEQAHERHVAELQRQHQESLEETRGHAKKLVEEEVARALSESKNLGSLNESVEAQPAEDFLSPGARRELKAVWDHEAASEPDGANGMNGAHGAKLDDAALRRVFDQVGPVYSDAEWSAAFAKMDRKGRGRVEFAEFKLWLADYSKGAKEKIAHGKTEMLREAMATGGDDTPVLIVSSPAIQLLMQTMSIIPAPDGSKYTSNLPLLVVYESILTGCL
jgi:hypothetical protein